MRIVILTLLLALAPACNRHRQVKVQHTEEEASTQLASVVHVADPRASGQLVSGFYDIEQNAWRWSASKFAVLLRPPRGAAQKGATLQLKFSVPQPVIDHVKTVSLMCSVNGTSLAPESYTQAGEFVYTRDVPPPALAGEAAKVEFSLDKFLAPGQVDQRELGVVVSSVGFEPK